MRVTSSVHTGDDTDVEQRIIHDSRGKSVSFISIGSDVTIFVTRQSAASIQRAAAQLIADMDIEKRAAEVAAQQARGVPVEAEAVAV